MAQVWRGVPRVSPVLKAEEAEALSRARRRISSAESEAARIVAEAEGRAAAVLEEARLSGLARGRAEAAALAAGAAVERDRILAAAGPEVVALALEGARKVLDGEVRTAPEVVAGLARRAVEAARERRSVRLRVSGADLERVRAALPAGLAVEPDPDLGRGACVVVTEAGRIEAGLDAQLAEIARALLPEARP